MLRYARLYAYCVRFSVSKALEFRVDFWFRVVMDTIYYAVNIAFFRVLFDHTTLLAGWTLDQVLIFMAGYLVLDALYMTLFSTNLWWFPFLVNRGDLDYYLTRPVSSLFLMSLREFATNSGINLLFALGILAWAIGRAEAAYGAVEVLLFLILLGVGCVLYYATHMLLVIPVVWTHSARGFSNVFFVLTRFLERPDRLFTGWVRVLLTTILPFSVMASFPARGILEGFTPDILARILGVTGAMLLAVVLLWRRALRSYSSASS